MCDTNEGFESFTHHQNASYGGRRIYEAGRWRGVTLGRVHTLFGTRTPSFMPFKWVILIFKDSMPLIIKTVILICVALDLPITFCNCLIMPFKWVILIFKDSMPLIIKTVILICVASDLPITFCNCLINHLGFRFGWKEQQISRTFQLNC